MKDNGRRIVVMAPGITTEELAALNVEIKKAVEDPNHIIVTSFAFEVREVGIKAEEET